MWERENQTDFKLTLHCMNWLSIVGRNDVNQVFASGANQGQIVQGIAKNSYHPIGVGSISPSLTGKTLPRGKVIFGNPKKYFEEISRDNNFQWWIQGNGKLNVAGLNDRNVPISTKNPIKYTPTTGIVGTPQQTQYGCNFRLLLDSSVSVQVPAITVNIDNTQIRQQLKIAGVVAGLSAQDGTYVVVGPDLSVMQKSTLVYRCNGIQYGGAGVSRTSSEYRDTTSPRIARRRLLVLSIYPRCLEPQCFLR